MNLSRVLASLSLAAVGAFFYFISSFGYSSGFVYQGVGLSLITVLSTLSLLSASVVVLRSFKGSNENSQTLQRTYGLVYLGLILAIAAPLIPFPVGCNLDAWPCNLTNVFHGCPASPEGVWSTIWPNALSTCVGVVLVTAEYGKLRSKDAALPGLGVGFMVSGFLLLIRGLTIGYFTSCPANGCLPLTAGQWWSLFWPDVVADVLGAALILAGSAILITRWRLKAKQATPSEIGRPFTSGPSQ